MHKVAPTEGTGAVTELDWRERGGHHVSHELLLLMLWKPRDHNAPNYAPGKPDVPGNGLQPEGQPLAFYKHVCFPVPRFPYLHKFPGVRRPGEKETIKTICILAGRGGPSVVLALNSPQGGCENFPAVLWGQPAGQVHLGQVQGNYLQPREGPEGPLRKPDYSIYGDSVSQRQSATTQSMAELPPGTLGWARRGWGTHKSPPPHLRQQETRRGRLVLPQRRDKYPFRSQAWAGGSSRRICDPFTPCDPSETV